MLPDFEYVSFEELQNALRFLDEHGNAKVLGGGTDILVQLRDRKFKPKYLVDLSRIGELRGIKDIGENIYIGSMTLMRELEESHLLTEHVGLIVEAAKAFGFWQLKNIATIGGNLCNASPASDMASTLISLSAKVRLLSSSGERIIPIEEFFLGLGKTVLSPGEILAGIIIPKDELAFAFMKLGKRAAHILSIVNVAVSLKVEDGECKMARVALGSVAPIPIRAREVENKLKGRNLSEDVIQEASKLVLQDIAPISDVRASAEYRKEMSVVMVRRAIKEALRRSVK